MNLVTHLGLFAKFWQPTRVKTRLAEKIGANAASQIYYEFLEFLLRQHRATANRRTVVFSPGGRLSEFSRLCGRDWELSPQSSGDLGNRMKTFFQHAFEQNRSSKVIVIGSDCPLLDQSRILHAAECLDRNPVVIGPSPDGGYYLIGMNKPYLEIFENVAWSTPQVLPQTLGILDREQIGYDLLPEMYDVDDYYDLEMLMSELQAQAESLPTARAQLGERIKRILDEETP